MINIDNKRESWWLKNKTTFIINIGDLRKLPSIKPGRTVDLLKFETKENIGQSTNLVTLIRNKNVTLRKETDFDNRIVRRTEASEAITSVETDEIIKITQVDGDNRLVKTVPNNLLQETQIIIDDDNNIKPATDNSLKIGSLEKRFSEGHFVDGYFGSTIDNLSIINGVVTLNGDAKRTLTLRGEVNMDEIRKNLVPDQVPIGEVFFGYSMPIYNLDNEELFYRENVPGRWDGTSDIVVMFAVCLSAAEVPGRTFRCELAWNHSHYEENIIPLTAHKRVIEIIVVDGTQYATYLVEFEIDISRDPSIDPIMGHDLLSMRLRRVASGGVEIAGEIIVLDWHTMYRVDKMFRDNLY